MDMCESVCKYMDVRERLRAWAPQSFHLVTLLNGGDSVCKAIFYLRLVPWDAGNIMALFLSLSNLCLGSPRRFCLVGIFSAPNPALLARDCLTGTLVSASTAYMRLFLRPPSPICCILASLTHSSWPHLVLCLVLNWDLIATEATRRTTSWLHSSPTTRAPPLV